MYTGNIKLQRSSLGDGQIRMMHLRQTDRELHGHTFFELVYIIGGTATHWMEQASAPLRAGDYFIMDPGSQHCYRDTRDLELVNCLFLPEYIDRALGDCPSLSSLLSNRVMRFGVPVDVKTADRIFHDDDGQVCRLIRQMEQEYLKIIKRRAVAGSPLFLLFRYRHAHKRQPLSHPAISIFKLKRPPISSPC